MLDIVTTIVFEITIKLVVGMFLFQADKNLAYAYAVHEGYKYYQAFERAMAFRKMLKNQNLEKLGEGMYKVNKDDSDSEE